MTVLACPARVPMNECVRAQLFDSGLVMIVFAAFAIDHDLEAKFRLGTAACLQNDLQKLTSTQFRNQFGHPRFSRSTHDSVCLTH